jgi:hypothetical protein
MRVSKQRFSVQVVIDKKQPENEECFKHLCSLVTTDARCIREIPWKKTAFRKKTLFISKWDINLRKKVVKCYVRSVPFLWCCKFDT